LGEFKWFINELADEYSPFLVSFGIVTQKQVIRMADSELLTELCQLILTGIVNKGDKALRDVYKNNDEVFERAAECSDKIRETLNFVREMLGDLSGTFVFKPYVFYSLIAALFFNRWGSPSLVEEGDAELASLGRYLQDLASAKNGLTVLASAHEGQDTYGPYAEYVRACLSTTHRVAQRRVRAKWLLRALNGEIA
jgi:hypothetical protein